MDRQRDTHTHTDYNNPHCACAHKGHYVTSNKKFSTTSMYGHVGTMHHVVCILCCTDHNQYHKTFSCNKDSLFVLSSACSTLNFRHVESVLIVYSDNLLLLSNTEWSQSSVCSQPEWPHRGSGPTTRGRS